MAEYGDGVRNPRARQRAFCIGAAPEDVDFTELRELLRTAGVAVNGEMSQHRPQPDPDRYFGKGKLAELKKAAKQAGCVLRLKLKDEGHTHIPAGSEAPEYKTSPPTSGNHVEPPYQQADGAYSEMPREIFTLHSLEHGRLAIAYSPDLSEEDQLELKGLYDTMYGGTLLYPDPDMDYAVAATTWTNLLGCPQYKGAITLDAIRDFGKATWGRYGGEEVAAFTIEGPTPKKPQS